jgi:hypothetical protein
MGSRVSIMPGSFEQVITAESVVRVEVLKDSKLDSISFRLVKNNRRKHDYKENIRKPN